VQREAEVEAARVQLAEKDTEVAAAKEKLKKAVTKVGRCRPNR
jgi:hypothetical protein